MATVRTEHPPINTSDLANVLQLLAKEDQNKARKLYPDLE
jgi:hypothetical protein